MADLGRWQAWLDGEIQVEAATMEAELGGEMSCRIHKDGRVTGGLKYHEGKMNAYAEARRLSLDPANLDANMAAFRKRWADELERRKTTEPSSPPWIAYATGGLEAADRTLAALKTGGGPR